MSEPVRDPFQAARRLRIVRVGRDERCEDVDVAAVEEPLEIRLHDRAFAVVMRTPGCDRELAAGFLLSEGIVAGAADLGAVEHCRHPARPDAHNVVNVFLLGEARGRLDAILAERRNVAASTACGVCGRLSIDALKTRAAPLVCRAVVNRAVIRSLPDSLRARQTVFDQTGGLHAAALFSADGELVVAAEDVGRHNAVDKVLGSMLLDERLPMHGHVLAVSGRSSFEIVQKAWLGGVEVICAVSAPSSLAVELAEEAGITLIGFARGSGFNIYAHPERVQ